MAYDFLKKLFGTSNEGEAPKAMTYEELEAAIDGDKTISIVNLKDGGFVSKDKFDAKDTELKGVQTQLATANETIKGFEGQDVEGIKAKVTEWEQKYTADTTKLQEQLAAQERSHAEEMFLSGYHFTSKAARNGVLAELRAKDLKIENGSILGGKEFIDGLMADDEYKGAFVVKPADNNNAGNNGTGGNGNAGNQGGIAGSGNTYNGQAQPRFSAGTNGGVGSSDNIPKFNFGFNRIREPEQK